MNIEGIKRIRLDGKRRKRVGRGDGSGHGKTSGRGHNGAGQRSGGGAGLRYAGGQTPLFRRFPKRGFSNAVFRKQYVIVHVGELNRFPEGAEVNAEAMHEAGLLRKPDLPVKLLSDGDLKVALTVEADGFSRAAVRKIEAAGGSAKLKGG